MHSRSLAVSYRHLCAFALSVSAAGAVYLPAIARSVPSVSPVQTAKAQKARVAHAYGRLPLAFEQNQGQSDPQVKYLAKGPGYSLFLTPTQAVMALSHPSAAFQPGHRPAPSKASVLRMTLQGANPAPAIMGENKLPGQSTYCVGQDRSKWRAHVASYGQVSYTNVYKGVDLRYYGNQKQLEYDFIVQPGADPKSIALGFEGAQSVALNKAGDLLLSTAGGDVRWHKPVAYQVVQGHKVTVLGKFIVSGRTARFAVGWYDKKLPLTIDPSLGYSTFLGGNDSDYGNAITVDSSGFAYVTGFTYSTNFPRTLNDSSINSNVFITKVNKTGTALVYSVLLGGGGYDGGYAIAVDSHGNVDIGGAAYDSSFPVNNPSDYKGDFDSFVAQLKPDGSGFNFIQFIHPSGSEDVQDDEARGIGVDSSDNIYVGGYSEYDTDNFHTGGYVLKFNSAGTYQAVAYIYGPTGGSTYGYGLAVDASNNVYLTGETDTPYLYNVNNSFSGGGDAFVAKLNSSLENMYATYLGGTGYDVGHGIAADASGNAYVTGQTYSSDFPTTEGPAYIDNGDPFVTKISSNGSILSYSTLLKNTTGLDQGGAIAVDSSGQAYVTGGTFGTGNNTENVFVAQMTSTGNIKNSRNLIGEGDDYGFGIAVGSNSVAYVTGVTYSSDFRVTTGAYDTSYNGVNDSFVDAVAFNSPVLTSLSPTSVHAGSATFTLTANGTGFQSGAKVYFNMTALTTTFVSSTKVTASVPASLVTHTGTASITVTNPNANGSTDPKTLTITSGAVTITSLSLSPTSVVGGSATSTGTITLSGPAPAGGLAVTQTSSNTAAATLAPTLNIAAGATSAKFKITTYAVSSTKSVTITSAANGSSKTATLTVTSGGVTITSLSLSPTSVKGGSATSTGTITLSGPAPAGGLAVTQTSSNTAAATLAPTLNIAAGATSAKFKITTYAVSSTKSVTITSAANGSSKTATLTVMH